MPPFHDVPISFDPEILHTQGEFICLAVGPVHLSQVFNAFSVPSMSLPRLHELLQAGRSRSRISESRRQGIMQRAVLAVVQSAIVRRCPPCELCGFYGKMNPLGSGMWQARSSTN